MDDIEKFIEAVLMDDFGFDEHSAKKLAKAAKKIYKHVNKDIKATLKEDIKNGTIKINKTDDGREYVVIHDGVDPDVGIWTDTFDILTDDEMKKYSK